MSEINVNSETWDAVTKRIRIRIEDLRDELEYDHGATENAELRGMIRFAREVLKFPESEQPAPIVKSGEYY